MSSAAKHFAAERRYPGNAVPPACEPWQIPFGDSTLAIRPWAPDIASERMGDAVRLCLTIAGEPAEVLAPAAALKLLVDRLEPLAQWDRLSPTARGAVMEGLFSEPLGAIEARTGKQIIFGEIGAASAQVQSHMAFELIWQGLSLPLCGCFSDNVLAGLRQWASRLPRRRLTKLTTTVAIRRAYAVLSVDELERLSIGDGIIVESALAEGPMVVTGERFLATCILSDEDATLCGPLLGRPMGARRHFMSNETIDEELQGPPRISSIGDIPVKLVFDIARIELPLSEVEGIAEGHIFTLDRPRPDVVEIVAQGRIIGRGEIVTLEDITAVRVTALHD